MIIFLILGIIATIIATIGCLLIIAQWTDSYNPPSISTCCFTIFVTIAFILFSICCFKQYYNKVVDYAMWNMQNDNYICSERVENGNVVKVTYKVGNIDFD